MRLALLPLFFAAILSLPVTGAAEDSLIVRLLPDTLHDMDGNKVDPASLEGKVVGLYFSAHWCGPCRAFTPALKEFYEKHQGENFEIVFVSMDRSNTEKQNYVREAEMPWLTFKGARSKHCLALAEAFGIPGIPSLVVIGPDENIASLHGTEDVMRTPDTALERWRGESRS